MEGRDEVKKIVEEREYSMVRLYTHTHSPSVLPIQLGLDSDQSKQLLSLLAWRRLEHGDMCCSLPALCSLKGKTRIQQGCRGEAVQTKSYISLFCFKKSSDMSAKLSGKNREQQGTARTAEKYSLYSA